MRTYVSALVVCLAVVGARAQTCEIHFESFDRFSDPQGFDDGVFAAAWCRNGADIASSSFCNSGGALRLNSAVDDPVLWIYVGDLGVSTVTIEFDYSQFADTGTRVYASGSIDPAFNCNANVSQLVGALTTTGGACTRTTITVAPNGAQSIYFRFAHGVNANAVYIDNLAISVEGGCDGQQQPCDETGGPGCDDQTIQDCVCEQDPYCCDIAWDEICVAETATFGCVSGGPGCATDLSTDFGTGFATGTVCERFPTLFEFCAGSGPYLTTSGDCAGPGDAAMRFGTGFPYSSATSYCLDFSNAASPSVSFVYAKDTGTLGPKLEASIDDGQSFAQVWSAPFSVGAGCHPVVVDLSALAGEPGVRLRWTSGSSTGNNATIDDIVLNLDGNTLGDHPPCEVGGPGSDDAAVNDCVCAVDPYCCDLAWDEVCVEQVETLGCGTCENLCLDEFLIDFGDTFLSGDLCSLGPTIFSACDGVGPYLTSAAPSGGVGDMAVSFGEGWAYSAFTTRCIDASPATEMSLRFNYSKLTNTLGPRVEVSSDGGQSFATIWTAPFSVGAGEHQACVDLGAYAGIGDVRLKFSAGTSLAQSHQIDDILVLFSDPCVECAADVTTQGAGVGEPGYGTPDGAATGADISWFVNAWVAQDSSADVTTQGAGAGDVGNGEPDGTVTGADINFYVNLWVGGCP